MHARAAVLLTTLFLAHAAAAQGAASPAPDTAVTQHAEGSFEVKLTPQPVHAAVEGVVGRMSIAKEFRGELEGSSAGEMLAVMTAVQGSAGYVAMERFTGTLAGRGGSFALQHSGTMDRGAPTLVVTVVPDSGTGQLEGIAGTMRIIIEGGAHRYEFDYTLP